MKTTRLALNIMAVFATCLFCSTLVQAQTPRTWVSDGGNDANPCSRSNPCKTFTGAIARTSAGGKITCLDMGEFGPVTIMKSVTIDCRRTRGDILAASTNGIVINASTTDKIILQGMTIDGDGAGGLDGIRFLAGGSLHVEDVAISNMTNGINAGLNQVANAEVYVTNSSMRNNSNVGMFVSNAGGGLITMTIEKTTVENNVYGLIGRNNSRIDARDSAFSGNSIVGVLSEVLSPGAVSIIGVVNCLVTNNGTGLSAGSSAIPGEGNLRVSGTTITFNGIGVTAGNGFVNTFSDNILRDNTSPGAFSLPSLTKN
ncbi:MAG: hypothetical protein WBV94_16665 [Blastocatellia bacterium]